MAFIIPLLVLGFLIFIHELGHFLAAKSVGVKVEEFSVGFPPKIFSRKLGNTTYSLGLLPFGGYVKLYGMNFEDENREEQDNFASKNGLQKFWVILAGPLMNLLLAFLVIPFVYVIGTEKPRYLLEDPVVYSVQEEGLAEKKGVKPWDRLISLNGRKVSNWDEFNGLLADSIQSGVLRVAFSENGKRKDVIFTKDEFLSANGFGWYPHAKPLVGNFVPERPAARSGLRQGDLIKNIQGESIDDFSKITEVVQKYPGEVLLVAFERDGQMMETEIKPVFDGQLNRWLIGLQIPSVRVSYGFADSMKIGAEKILMLTVQIFDFLKNLVSGSVHSEEVGGPIAIFNILGSASESGLSDLLFILSFISFQLAILNLLPIPALDGGHILLIVAEKIIRRPASLGFRRRYQQFGFLALISLMLFVTFLDISKLF